MSSRDYLFKVDAAAAAAAVVMKCARIDQMSFYWPLVVEVRNADHCHIVEHSEG